MPRRDPTRRSTRIPRLLERVIQQRRPPAAAQSSREQAEKAPRDEPEVEQRLEALEGRLQQLESLVEGLQDSVHRESARHQRELEDLQHRTLG
jgi:uncharacterized protein YceH (UPF0502 family)